MQERREDNQHLPRDACARRTGRPERLFAFKKKKKQAWAAPAPQQIAPDVLGVRLFVGAEQCREPCQFSAVVKCLEDAKQEEEAVNERKKRKCGK